MRLLAIDAATECCSVALLANDEIHARDVREVRAQSDLLLPMVSAVLEDGGTRLRDLDAIVVGRGPGAFTGVRLAIGVAQGLAYGAELPVIPVSDLAMLAQGVAKSHACGRILACMDARMGEVYWCGYVREPSGLVTPLHAERLGSPASVSTDHGQRFVGVGSGWARHDALAAHVADDLVEVVADRLPHARDALALAAPLWTAGQALEPERVVPVYLRDEVATRSSR